MIYFGVGVVYSCVMLCHLLVIFVLLEEQVIECGWVDGRRWSLLAVRMSFLYIISVYFAMTTMSDIVSNWRRSNFDTLRIL